MAAWRSSTPTRAASSPAWTSPACSRCYSACNCEPPKGVYRRPTLTPWLAVSSGCPFQSWNGWARDADRGNDRADPARVLCEGEDDQGDRPGPEGLAQHGSEGSSLRGQVVRVRARGSAATEAGRMAGGA